MLTLPVVLILTSFFVEAKPSPFMRRILNTTRSNDECTEQCDEKFADSSKSTQKATCEASCEERESICQSGASTCAAAYTSMGWTEEDSNTLCEILCGKAPECGDGCKDCQKDCNDEFKDQSKVFVLSTCLSACTDNDGKCPKEVESNSKCKDEYEENPLMSKDDFNKMCDIVCGKKSLWWVGLVVGLVVIIAVVVVLVVICFVKKLLCFKGSA